MRHPNRSPALLLALALSSLTAVALLRAAALVGHAEPAAASEDIAHRFYAAANAVIQTGDPAPIDAVVASDLVAHGPLAAPAPGRSGLARTLFALHATAPGLQLVVEALTASGDQAVARIGIEGGTRAFLGAAVGVDQAAPWPALEVLRVADGRIVERWAVDDRLGDLRPLLRVPLGDLPAGPAVVGLARLAYAPGAAGPLHTDRGPAVALVEEGGFALRAEGPAQLLRAPAAGAPGPWRPVPVGTEVALVPGDQILLPAATRRAFRNAGRGPATLLTATVFDAESRGLGSRVLTGTLPWSAAWPVRSWQGIRVQHIAGGVATMLPGEGCTIALGRAALAPGARLPLVPSDGVALVAVEAGTLDPATTGEAARARPGAPGEAPASPNAEAALTAGDGVLLGEGRAGALGSAGAGPVVVLVATVTGASTR